MALIAVPRLAGVPGSAGTGKGFTASELFSGFLGPDKLQDTTAIERRRSVAAQARC